MSLKQTFTSKMGKRVLAGIMSAMMIMTSFSMMPVKAEEGVTTVTVGADGKIDLSTAKVYTWKHGEALADKSAILYDGDTTTTVDTPNQAFTVFDLGREYEISKIILNATGEQNNEFVGVSNDTIWTTGTRTEGETTVTTNQSHVTAVLRNKEKQNGVKVIEATKSDASLAAYDYVVVGPVTPTSGDTSGAYRFVIVYNWSKTCRATEVAVYTMTEEEKVAAALAKAKTEAKTELNSYFPEGAERASYTDENYAIIETARTEGVTAIEAATTTDEVATALANAKTQIDAVEQIVVSDTLPAYKETAIAEISSKVDANQYDALGQNTIDAIVKDATATINLATTNTEEKVDTIKIAAIANLEAVLTNVQVAAADKTQDAQVGVDANNGDGSVIGIKTTEDGTTDNMGLLKFPVDSTKKVKSATLRLVAERTKYAAKEIKLSRFDASWNEKNIHNGSLYATDAKNSYAFLKNALDAARESQNAVTATLNGVTNKAIFDLNPTTTTLADWTTEIDVTSLIHEGDSEVNLLLSKTDRVASANNMDTNIFTKDYATFPREDRYATIKTIVEASGEDVSYLAPKLTIEYEGSENPVPESDSFYTMHVDNVTGTMGGTNIQVPLYFDELQSSTHAVGGMTLRVYFDANALEYVIFDAPMGSIAKTSNAFITPGTTVKTDENGDKYMLFAIAIPNVITKDTAAGKFMDLYFNEKDATDKTKYDITVISEPVERYNIELGKGDGTKGYGTVTAGSITFGTPTDEPEPVETALERVNKAADAAALKAVVETDAAELGLDLAAYNALTGKDAVMTVLVAQKPYTDAAAFKAAFNAAVAAQAEAEATPALPPHKLGDVNNDGSITLADALLALQISVATDKDFTTQPVLSADVNKDNDVTVTDVLAILQKANGKTVAGLE